MDVGYRLGSFFILLGLGLIFLFWMTTQGERPEPILNLLIFGGGSLVLGVWMAWRSRPKPQDVERFSTLRKVFRRKKKEEKK
jgi:hypothetical protein